MVGTHRHLVSRVSARSGVLYLVKGCGCTNVCILVYKAQINCDYSSVLISYTGFQATGSSLRTAID